MLIKSKQLSTDYLLYWHIQKKRLIKQENEQLREKKCICPYNLITPMFLSPKCWIFNSKLGQAAGHEPNN